MLRGFKGFNTLKAAFFYNMIQSQNNLAQKKDKKLDKQKKSKRTLIGGQAVLEGVMMRGASSIALAVRDEDGVIRLETERIKPASARNAFFRLPIIRGVYSFISSLTGGTKYLMRSADVYGEGEPSRFEKWAAEKLKVNVMSIITTFSLVVGLFLAMFLFIWLPQAMRTLIERWANVTFGIWAKNFIEGGFKLLIFILYLLFCTLLKDIRRTFMYHGAEHKTISCFERGMDLTIENVRRCPRVHDRCGTTFIVFVLVISIIAFACFEGLISGSVNGIFRVLLKLLMLPIVAGISYELLRGLAKTDSVFVFPLKVPGLLLQRITTREPDDKMIEVAITSFKAVLEMDADASIPARKFITAEKRPALLERVSKTLSENGITEQAEAEWIVSISLGIKRSQVREDKMVSPTFVEKVNKLLAERCSGRPLWYCVGDTEFCGIKIRVDERALIPRPETELLAEEALKCLKEGDAALDLCTGSGAIAITLAKKSGCKVTASDVSIDALSLAKENAMFNACEIDFVESNLFDGLKGKKFNVIVSNPPYIKTDDIQTLQPEIRNFEPLLALDGGGDGLDFYKTICKKVSKYFDKGGVLLLEVGDGQADDIVKMLKGAKSAQIIKDYEGKDRIVKAVF